MAWDRIKDWSDNKGLNAKTVPYPTASQADQKKQLLHGELEFPSLNGHRCKYLIAPPDMEAPEDILVHMFSKEPQVKNGWRLKPPNLSVYGVGSRGHYSGWIRNVKDEH